MEASRAGQFAGSALAGLIGGGILLAAVTMAASIADRADVPVEAISARIVAVAVAAALVVAIGVVALAVTKNRDVLMLSALATLLILVSVAGLFSIGILVLPFAIGAIYLLVRRSAGRFGLAGAMAAGTAIAMGLSVLFVVWVQPPLVECTEGGASTTGRPWWSGEGSSGEASSGEESSMGTSDGQTTRGTIDTPSGRYVFSCRGDDLIQFRSIGR